MIITRDGEGKLNALINACQHRGTTLTRRQGQPIHLHLPVPRLVLQKRRPAGEGQGAGEYPEGFDTRASKKARNRQLR